MTLAVMIFTSLTAMATEYITDVMLIGAYAQADYNNLVARYTSAGWKATNWDLNHGIAWGSGDAILLLYKTAESNDGYNHEYITDFYIQNRSAANTKETLNYMGRTYSLVPVSDDSDDHFKGQYGDLNSHTGASTDPIHLYYTKETFADNRVVTGITFNEKQSGGVGKEGDTKTGYDLNAGCSDLTSQQIYMHLTTATAPVKDCYISEVKLVGAGTSDELDTYLSQYAVNGWKVIDYNLNRGIDWGDGDAIYLLYKTTISPDGLNHGYITDFYLQNRSAANTTTTLNYNDRLYQIVQYVGSDHFQTQMGDLNSGTGASTDPIHLYCTTDRFFTDGRAVTGIYFNATQSGAVGKEGGSTGFDLNAGCSNLTSQQIYMHFTTASTYRNSPTQSYLDLFEPQASGFRVQGWAFNPDEPDAQLPIRIEIRDAYFRVYREYGNLTTNVLRTDVNDTYTLTGNHGFDQEFTIVGIPAGTYFVRVFASNLANGEKQVGYNTLTINELTLANNADNSEAIGEKDERTCRTVTLAGRTLWKDGDWNTLCLPFNLAIAGSPLDGDNVDVRTLSSAELDKGTLTLTFTPATGEGAVTELVAGIPYIIKWDDKGTTLTETDLVFSNATIDKTVRNKVCDLGDGKSITFCGTYDPISFTTADRSILFLGGNNKLFYPETGANIGPCRAYFQLDGITAADLPANNVKMFFGDTTDGVGSIENGKLKIENEAGAWYTLDGRKVLNPQSSILNQKLPRGIYIHNSRKVVIK